MLAGSLCLSPSESFLAAGSWGSFLPTLGEVLFAGVVDGTVEACKGEWSLEGWPDATAAATFCLGG